MDLKKNYGNNLSLFCCKKRYIIGNKMNLSLIIIMSLNYTLITSLWIISLYTFYSLYIYILGIFLYSLLIYYYLKSFFTEPGIIPRDHPKYILNKDKIKAKEDSENIFKLIENSHSNLDIDTDETGVKNLSEIFTENKSQNSIKMNKIFPDFILAESAEDLNSNKNINNSIIARPNSIINENNLTEKTDSIFSGNKNIYLYSKIKRKNNDSNILKKEQENSLDIEVKNNNNNINNNFIPHIFTKRPCYTCNIIRPPKTSHCVLCDNCIKEMDHHCFYISNCVGERNRKFFVLFLIYGLIISVLFIFTSIHYLIYTFFFNYKYKYLSKLLFKKYKIPTIISFIIMFNGILILFIKKNSIKLSSCIFIPGNIIFDICFYITKRKYQKEKNNIFDFNYHPFNITLIYAILPLFILAYKYLRKQIKLIGKNLTTKQYMSIKEERNKNKQNTKIFYYLDSILQKKIDYKNIFKFFFKKQTPSLINIGNIKKIG